MVNRFTSLFPNRAVYLGFMGNITTQKIHILLFFFILSLAIHAQDDLPACWEIVADDFEGDQIADWSKVPADTLFQPRLVIGEGTGNSSGLEINVVGTASYLYRSALRPAKEGYLTFRFKPENLSIPDTSGWFTGNSFRVASILGGSEWWALVALRIRQSQNTYKGFIEYRHATLGTQYDYQSGEFDILPDWQSFTLGFAVDSFISVWRNDTLVREIRSIDHAIENASIIELGKSTNNSAIIPSGRLYYDNVSYKVPLVNNLYVDASTGNDTLTGNDPLAPLQTIQRAAELAGPGTVVYINPGRYHEKVELLYSGEPGKYIEFRASSSDSVIIDGQGIATDGTGSFFQISRLGYIKVSGIHVRNSDCSGFYAYKSNNIHISGCSTSNTFSSGIKVRDCNEVSVIGNDIRLACNGGGEECITVASSTHFEISYNTVHEGAGLYLGGEGICIKGNGGYGSVHHNQVYDLPKDYDPLLHEDGEVGIYIGAYSSTNYLNRVDVYANTCTTPIGIAVSSEEGGHTDSIRIFNNLVYNCYSTGIQITNWVRPNTGPKTNISIINNTVYHCGHLSGSWPVGQGIYVESKHPNDDNYQVSNNIVSRCGEFQIRVCEEAKPHTLVSDNLIDGYKGLSLEEVIGTGAQLADPGFVNEESGDFRLAGTSPAIDQGQENLNPGQSDFRDEDRVQGSGIDRGAFEWTPGLDPGPMPEYREIGDLTLLNGKNRCFDATGTISLPSNGTLIELQSGSMCNLLAKQSIRFLSGFHSKQGSILNARIISDSSFCDLTGGNQGMRVNNFKSSALSTLVIQEQQNISQQKFRIYPNPASTCIFVESECFENNSEIILYTTSGQQVYQGKLNKVPVSFHPLPLLRKGIYLVFVRQNNEISMGKLIVK